jgi:hypothetical protein
MARYRTAIFFISLSSCVWVLPVRRIVIQQEGFGVSGSR